MDDQQARISTLYRNKRTHKHHPVYYTSMKPNLRDVPFNSYSKQNSNNISGAREINLLLLRQNPKLSRAMAAQVALT